MFFVVGLTVGRGGGGGGGGCEWMNGCGGMSGWVGDSVNGWDGWGMQVDGLGGGGDWMGWVGM